MAEEKDEKTAPSLAVALKYDRTRDPAPRVVAKGKGTIAEQIVRIAEENGIVIREDANLVQILEKLDIDAIIPLEAYTAVAEILNYVYKANAKAKDTKRNTT
jgi:flagellar biosynthesis protein